MSAHRYVRSVDHSVWWALNGARHRWRRNTRPNLDYEPGVVWRSDGYAVTMARWFGCYARTTDVRKKPALRHRTRAVFIAWRNGKVARIKVVTWCGTELANGRLETAPVGPGCEMCSFKWTLAQRRQSSFPTQGR